MFYKHPGSITEVSLLLGHICAYWIKFTGSSCLSFALRTFMIVNISANKQTFKHLERQKIKIIQCLLFKNAILVILNTFSPIILLNIQHIVLNSWYSPKQILIIR